MGALGGVAFILIFVLLVIVTAVIVILGSLPGKIAKERNHPYLEAVNVASWVSIFTGILWPLVFIWAFLPVPTGRSSADQSAELAELKQRLAALEVAKADSQSASE
jgi:hypothetical protein